MISNKKKNIKKVDIVSRHVQPGDEHEWNLILKRHTDKPSDVMHCSS